MPFSIETYLTPESNEQEMQSNLAERLWKTIRRRDTLIAKGSSCEVFSLRDNPMICLKVIDSQRVVERDINTDWLKIITPLDKELELLDKACATNTTEVRIPRPYFYIHMRDAAQDHDVKVLAMERVRGVSLQDIYNKEYVLPAAFNKEKYFSALKSCLKQLNENGVSHNDIETVNLIVDLQNGLPGIIDFGAGSFVEKKIPETPSKETVDELALSKVYNEFENEMK
jgi:serine/threonine protein kinase